MSLRSINHLHRGLKSYAAPRLPYGDTFVQTAEFASNHEVLGGAKPGSKSLAVCGLKSYAAPRLCATRFNL